jgi:hypothetical protein
MEDGVSDFEDRGFSMGRAYRYPLTGGEVGAIFSRGKRYEEAADEILSPLWFTEFPRHTKPALNQS